jgi:hypothetical protein
MDVGLVAAYAALGISILAASTMIGGAVAYFVNLLREPQGEASPTKTGPHGMVREPRL